MKFYLRSVFRKILLLTAGLCILNANALASDNEVMEEKHFDPNIDLPASPGHELILRACTRCHELAGLEAYKGYWNFAQWKAMVVSMVENGAVLNPAEQDVVAEYLTRHFGPDAQ
ncbi:MAG: hypothetical protein V4628_00060 [Pseudomonadota bacterium]